MPIVFSEYIISKFFIWIGYDIFKTKSLETFCDFCLADIKYNPWTGQWESAPRDSSLKYNPWESEWSYERDSSELEYNPWTGEWKYER